MHTWLVQYLRVFFNKLTEDKLVGRGPHIHLTAMAFVHLSWSPLRTWSHCDKDLSTRHSLSLHKEVGVPSVSVQKGREGHDKFPGVNKGMGCLGFYVKLFAKDIWFIAVRSLTIDRCDCFHSFSLKCIQVYIHCSPFRYKHVPSSALKKKSQKQVVYKHINNNMFTVYKVGWKHSIHTSFIPVHFSLEGRGRHLLEILIVILPFTRVGRQREWPRHWGLTSCGWFWELKPCLRV